MKKIIFLITIFLFFATASFAEIDYSKISPNQNINIIFGKKQPSKSQIKKSYSHDLIFYKSATLAVIAAKTNPEYLSPENRFILRRPVDTNDPDYYGSGITVLTYDTPEGHFKIHYTEDNTNGDAVYGYDGDPATIPQFVIDVGASFELAWSHILSLGFPPLPGDNNKGGDSRFDVYILNLPGSYGYTSYDDSPLYTYIVIDNDFATVPQNFDPEGKQKGAIKVTAAHELFHAFQFQYSTNISKNGWWMETSSTWMEDEVFPEVKDYLNYIGLRYDDINDNGKWDIGETYYNIDGSIAGTTGRSSKWFDNPDMSLDTYNGSHEYGTVIWAKYLSGTYGNNVIKSVWNRIGSGSVALTSISDELSSLQTNLENAFGLFQVANYKRDYMDGNYYPIIKHTATYTSYPQTVNGTINHLASFYYAFKADDSPSILTFTFTNMNSANIASKLILTTTTGDYEEEDIVLNSPSVAKQITSFGTASNYSKAVLIIINTSLTDKETFSVDVNKETQSTSSDNQHGCFIATAVYGSYFDPRVIVLRKFRDEHLLTNPLGRVFVSFYYNISPSIAAFLEKHTILKVTTMFFLTALVYIIKYPQTALLLLVLTLLSLYSIKKKRQKTRGVSSIVENEKGP